MSYYYGGINPHLADFVKGVDAHTYTYIVTGKQGPTGKTYTCNWLKMRNLKAVEISEIICPIVSYDDNCNHCFIDHAQKIVVVVLNQHLEKLHIAEFVKGDNKNTTFTFNSSKTAVNFMDKLSEILYNYKLVLLSDAYDLVDKHVCFLDTRYGWKNLDGMCLRKSGSEYIVEMPEISIIEN